jgi:hypothetical protein
MGVTMFEPSTSCQLFHSSLDFVAVLHQLKVIVITKDVSAQTLVEWLLQMTGGE